MTYTKTVWKDLPDTTTPITASRLNNIEDGVEYLFENGTGGGDNLPVGVEMDFDGQASDIPTGWQQITSEQILWTNSDPSTTFANQTITLSSSDYDVLGIYYYDYRVTKGMQYAKAIKGEDIRLTTTFWYDNKIYIASRKIDFVSNTSLSVDNATGIETDAITTPAVTNAQCIPVKIVGYKTDLFN